MMDSSDNSFSLAAAPSASATVARRSASAKTSVGDSSSNHSRSSDAVDRKAQRRADCAQTNQSAGEHGIVERVRRNDADAIAGSHAPYIDRARRVQPRHTAL